MLCYGFGRLYVLRAESAPAEEIRQMTQGLTLQEERTAVSELGRQMLEQGLTKGTGGNISARRGDRVAISPSGMAYGDIEPEDVSVVDLHGERVDGDRKPSSEVRMHTDVLRERDDVGGVVHTHSPYASTFASLGQPVEAPTISSRSSATGFRSQRTRRTARRRWPSPHSRRSARSTTPACSKSTAS